MWMAVIAAIFISLIGYKALLVEAAVPSSPDAAMAAWQANDMASYRFAVESYANRISGAVGTVTPTAQDFPLGYIAPPVAMWTNQILTDGTILIYASTSPQVAGVTSAVNSVASSSPMLVQPQAIASAPASSSGLTTSLMSQVHDALTGTPAATLTVPVWLSHRG